MGIPPALFFAVIYSYMITGEETTFFCTNTLLYCLGKLCSVKSLTFIVFELRLRIMLLEDVPLVCASLVLERESLHKIN